MLGRLSSAYVCLTRKLTDAMLLRKSNGDFSNPQQQQFLESGGVASVIGVEIPSTAAVVIKKQVLLWACCVYVIYAI